MTVPTPHLPLPQRLADNLAAHLDCSQLLLTTLEHEHHALLANDVGSLEQLTATKAAAAHRLAELGGALNRLRSESGVRTIEELLARLDSSGASRARWQELIDLAARCSDANRGNAALLDARQSQIRSALRLLGQGAAPSTYGRYGTAGVAHASRALGLA